MCYELLGDLCSSPSALTLLASSWFTMALLWWSQLSLRRRVTLLPLSGPTPSFEVVKAVRGPFSVLLLIALKSKPLPNFSSQSLMSQPCVATLVLEQAQGCPHMSSINIAVDYSLCLGDSLSVPLSLTRHIHQMHTHVCVHTCPRYTHIRVQ